MALLTHKSPLSDKSRLHLKWARHHSTAVTRVTKIHVKLRVHPLHEIKIRVCVKLPQTEHSGHTSLTNYKFRTLRKIYTYNLFPRTDR